MREITPSDNQVSLKTDESWREESIHDNYGLVSASRLDVYLNPTETWDARGPSGWFSYDALGQVVEVLRPDETRQRFEYDAEGSLLKVVDGRGTVKTAKYSSYGDCLEQVDPSGRVYRYAWDTEGRLTAIWNPKGEHSRFHYDVVGNLVRIEHSDGTEERFDFDRAGRVVRRQGPGQEVIEFEYDSMGNELKAASNGRELRSARYDLCGVPVEAKTPDATVMFEYAVGGDLEAEIQNGRRISYRYDESGRIKKRTFEGSKAGALIFEHDARGRLTSFGSSAGAQVFSYEAGGLLSRRRMGSIRETYEYDSVGRVRHQRVDGIYSRTHRWDPEGALSSADDSRRGRRDYTYSPSAELIQSIRVGEEVDRYGYDSSGNLVAHNEWTILYAPGDRILRSGDTVFASDEAGRLIRRSNSAEDTRYIWNELGQPIEVEGADGSRTKFGYDAFGRRTFKEHRGKCTSYFWSGDDLLAEETAERLTEYAIREGWPEALWEDGEIRHVLTSHHGVPQELVDAQGHVVWRGEYDDWGRLVREEGVTTCRLRLLGQIADPETGLHYNRHRYYLPENGRFISPDPATKRNATRWLRWAYHATAAKNSARAAGSNLTFVTVE